MKVNVGDVWKDVAGMQINIGDLWKNVNTAYINIGDTWKTFYTIGGVLFIGAGNQQTLIIENGQVWAWGLNSVGQLGDNSVISRCIPVSILGAKKTFCAIAAGQNYSLGLDKNGQVWGWGYNYVGQLGNKTKINRCTPVSILGAKKTFCKITAGRAGGTEHSAGLDKNGQVWCWGYNGFGQLGTNSTSGKCTPVSILGAKKTFCTIIAGYVATFGIDKNGQVWSWGLNGTGQLGINSTASRRTPVSILGAKKTFCTIDNRNTTLAIDKNGQVWGWGYNFKYQLGDNTSINKCTPVSILGAKKTFCAISVGSDHSVGLDKNGQVWCWGANSVGQLGINSTGIRCTPVSILGAKKTFCTITAGYTYTIGVDKNNHVWGWGYNVYGNLGTNSTTSRLTPVRVCNF